MRNGTVAIVPIQVARNRQEHLPDDTSAVIDIRQQRTKNRPSQIPRTGEDIYIPEAAENAGKY